MSFLNEDCPICKNKIDLHHKVTTPCNHAFCTACFFKWIKEGRTCPLCRKIFIKDTTTTTTAARQELSDINHQIDIDYAVLNSLQTENTYLQRRIQSKITQLKQCSKKLEQLQKYIDYKRDWIDLYNVKIKSHGRHRRYRLHF